MFVVLKFNCFLISALCHQDFIIGAKMPLKIVHHGFYLNETHLTTFFVNFIALFFGCISDGHHSYAVVKS